MFSPLSKIHNLDWFMCFLTRVATSFKKIQMLRACFKKYISIKKVVSQGKVDVFYVSLDNKWHGSLILSLGLSKFVLAIDQS